jgi:hypothetical protein
MDGTRGSLSGKVGQSEYVEQRPAAQLGSQFLGALEYTGHPLSRVHKYGGTIDQSLRVSPHARVEKLCDFCH